MQWKRGFIQKILRKTALKINPGPASKRLQRLTTVVPESFEELVSADADLMCSETLTGHGILVQING